MVAETSTVQLKGGEFLVKESLPEHTFIPEQFGEEALMIARTVLKR